jgi:hypothetical protein
VTENELFIFAGAFLAGWEHGEREGYDRAYREADAQIAAAVTAALGGQGETDRAAAVARHIRTVEAIERRRRFDLAEVAA